MSEKSSKKSESTDAQTGSSKGKKSTDSSASSTASCATIPSANSEAAGDKVTPIVELIKNREKENEGSMQKLREAIVNERKQCLEMRQAIEEKRKIVNDLYRENERMEAELSEAMQHIKTIAARKQQEKLCTKDEEGKTVIVRQFPVEEVQGELKEINQKLDQAIKEKQDNEKAGKGRPPSSGKRPVGEEKDPVKRLQLRKDLVKEVKSLVAEWLKKVGELKSGKPGEKPPTTFPAAVQHILQYIEAKLATSMEMPNLPCMTEAESKALEKQIEKRKADRHALLAKRMADRKPLEDLPAKIRRDYDVVVHDRQRIVGMPERKDNLVQYLTELYEWGDKEHERYKDQLAKLANVQKLTKVKNDEDEKLRQKFVADLNAEIKRAEQALEKAKAENRAANLPPGQKPPEPPKPVGPDAKVAAAAKSTPATKQGATPPPSKTTAAAAAASSGAMPQVEQKTPMQIIVDQARQEEALNELRTTKGRKEEELKRLDEEIGEYKRQIQDSRSGSSYQPSSRDSSSSSASRRTEIYIVKSEKN